MRRWWLILGLVLTVLACRAVQPVLYPFELPAATETLPPGLATASPSLTAPVTPQENSKPNWIPAVPPTATVESEFQVITHPEGILYVGDRVSFEIIPPASFEIPGQRASVRVIEPVVQEIGEVEFGRYGIGRREQATLTWAWNTQSLTAGIYELEFVILPLGDRWRQSVELLPAAERPYAGAIWKEAQRDCCVVHYNSGTEVERDLEFVLDSLEAEGQSGSEQLGTSLEKPITVTLAPRVLGHGGFAGEGITISYLDRLYTSSNMNMIFHHELVHIFDAQLGGELRPTMLVEGLAVYLSGGHFKPEPLLERAAALLPAQPGCQVCGLGWYIPLPELADDFYNAQHEIGYLQAGALVEILVERFGWDNFRAFYRDIHNDPGGSQALALDTALQVHFGLTLTELDVQFRSRLTAESLSAEEVLDVRLTVEFYDAVRAYQQRFDPAAFFQVAWLPDEGQMRAQGITADYLRRPEQAENIILENLLSSAGAALQKGEYAQAEERLETVEFLIENIPSLEGMSQAN